GGTPGGVPSGERQAAQPVEVPSDAPRRMAPPPPAVPRPETRTAPAVDKKREAAPYSGRFAEVKEHLAAGRVAKARSLAEAWNTEAPGDVLALLALGEAWEADGEPAAAARAYGSLIDLFPSRADLRRLAGERLERLGDAGRELAIDTYRKAVAERPDHPSGHRLLAWALLRAGRYEAAFEALEQGIEQHYPGGRFAGVDRVLKEDLGLLAAAWLHAEPSRRQEVADRLEAHQAHLETEPSLRFALTWETDANDVDLHVWDHAGGHAFYNAKTLPSGGELFADVTTGYGPECFAVRKPATLDAAPYRLKVHYYSRGPMGYGMGTVQVIAHDGKAALAVVSDHLHGPHAIAHRPAAVIVHFEPVGRGIQGRRLPHREALGAIARGHVGEQLAAGWQGFRVVEGMPAGVVPDVEIDVVGVGFPGEGEAQRRLGFKVRLMSLEAVGHLLAAGWLGVQPCRREQAQILLQHPVDAGETAARIVLLDALLERLEGGLVAPGAQERPGEEPVPRGVVRPLGHGLPIGVDRQLATGITQPFEALSGQPPQIGAAGEEVNERSVRPGRRGRLAISLPGLAQCQQGQHVARRFGVPGFGERPGLRDAPGGQMLLHLGEAPGVRRGLALLVHGRRRPGFRAGSRGRWGRHTAGRVGRHLGGLRGWPFTARHSARGSAGDPTGHSADDSAGNAALDTSGNAVRHGALGTERDGVRHRWRAAPFRRRIRGDVTEGLEAFGVGLIRPGSALRSAWRLRDCGRPGTGEHVQPARA